MKTSSLLLAAMPAAAGAFSIKPSAEPMKKASDSPLFQHLSTPAVATPRTHSNRLRSKMMLFRKNNSDSKYKLQAYTVAPEDTTSNPWFDFLNFRDSMADYADSLFSLEGGDMTPEPAKRPSMPNLEVEEQLTSSVAAATVVTETSSTETATSDLDKAELLMELNALSETFDDLQSRYESTIDNLKDENSFLEEGIKMLTVTIEEQSEQIELLQKQISSASSVAGEVEEVKVEEETDVDGIGAIFESKATVAEAEELIEFQNKLASLEEDNEMLRQRVRGLEVELSDVAFESRKIIAASVEETPLIPAPPAEEPVLPTPPTTAVAIETVENPIEDVNAISTDAVEEVTELAVEQVKSATLSPHAPPTPIPQHVLQKKEMEMLRTQVKEYEVERNSVRKLFGRGIRRGVQKVGKVLDLWRPIYLILCDGVRGDGKMAL